MDGANVNPEKDCGVLGGLFQTVVNDLRGSTSIWEDFTYKSVKLHASLKNTVVTIGAFLEAFQKVADMATSSKGATREIGSALTRLCLRHRSIESHLKVLTSSILDNLVAPLQEKLEDWKKAVAQIDKDHAKEHKKAKQEIKKAASDTMRLQKKYKKGGGGGGGGHGKSDMQHKLDIAMAEVNSKYHQMEETEKNALRSALIEERSRFCLFISCLKPFVDHELKLLTEISHINEIMDSLCMQASEPSVLPASSEQVILDLKGVDNSAWNFNQNSPPSSPSSLGSRKSSMCSINSINSSSSGSSKSHSPSHTMHKRTASQPAPPGTIRLTSVSSQDSGFTSQDTLFLRPHTPQSLNLYQAMAAVERDEGDCDSTPTTPSDNTPSASSTWNNWPNLPGTPRAEPARPHTISSAYEKGHTRPALKPDLFEPPQEDVEMRRRPVRTMSETSSEGNQGRPSATISKLQPMLPPHCPKPKGKAVAPPMLPPDAQPIYANTAELAEHSGQPLDPSSSPDDGEPTTPTTPASVSVAQGGETLHSPRGMLDLQEAIQQMDMCTAALHVEYDPTASDGSEEVTPRSSLDDPDGQAYETGTAFEEALVECPRPKIQQNTSLELAKAIRELEASTAALTSAYDTEEGYPAGNTAVPTATATSNTATYDADSYTSKTSLQCSSGYGTMNSTPASSEDTIASGGCLGHVEEEEMEEKEEEGGADREECLESDGDVDGEDFSSSVDGDVLGGLESEKYFTIPRSGEASAAYRMALHPWPKRPASTAGIPVSGSNIARRSSTNTPKPPPPVRRTASVTGAVPHHVQKMRNSPPRQQSADYGMEGRGGVYFAGGGEGMVEGAYAELQLIQQSIHGQPQVRPGPVTPASPSQAQRQVSGGAETYSPGGAGPPATPSLIQSLNAKFASLNSQYEEGGDGSVPAYAVVEGNGTSALGTGNQFQKPAPPAVMQKPTKSGIPVSPSPTSTLHYAQHQQQQLQQQHHHPGGSNAHNKGHPPHSGPIQKQQQQQQQQQQQHFKNQHHHQHQQHIKKMHGHHHQQQQQQRHNHHQQLTQQGHYSDMHVSHQLQQHQQQHVHQHQRIPEEDFPLPPTAEELQEMERIYSRPPPIGPSIRAPPINKSQPKRQPQPPPPKPQPPSGDVQASLLMELKRRVSVDDNSNV